MIRAFSLALVVVLLALTGCGGKQAAPATTIASSEHAAIGSGAMTEQPHEGMDAMPPELATFHDVIAPRWHAEKGPQRMKDTCAALPDMHSSADALAKATPPNNANADTWTTGTRGLVAALANLETTCKSNDATSFETAFAKVHESFHGLLAQAGVHHEEHEGMEHGEHKM
ncbi:MAG: hypothetical protein JWO36_6513 [Myxococcales bacterium]|nr:hypothetical protein [Myxococcales bacterium]